MHSIDCKQNLAVKGKQTFSSRDRLGNGFTPGSVELFILGSLSCLTVINDFTKNVNVLYTTNSARLILLIVFILN